MPIFELRFYIGKRSLELNKQYYFDGAIFGCFDLAAFIFSTVSMQKKTNQNKYESVHSFSYA